MQIDDETLIAYLDAQLTADADYERVEDALAADAGLRSRLHQLVESGVLARQAFAPKLDEPVPAKLIAAIISAPLPAPAGSRTTTPAPARNGLPTRIAAWLGGFMGGAAFASVMLLAMGALLAYYLLPTSMDARSGPPALALQGELVQDGVVLVALETAPSGRALNLGNTEVELVVSFMNAADQFCREFEVAHRGQSARTELGIACREAESQWRIAFIASEDGDASAPDVYRTASDRLHEAANDFLNAHAKGEPLDPLNELVLIGKGWPSGFGEAQGQPGE